MFTTNTPAQQTWTCIPQSVLQSYALAAVRLHGEVEQLESGEWFATASRFPGAWATGDTPNAALGELESVIQDWARLKAKDGDSDLPIIGEIDLNNIFSVRASSQQEDEEFVRNLKRYHRRRFSDEW